MKFKIIPIPNIETFEGIIPAGYDLVEYARGTDPVADGWCLMGFDEVNLFVGRANADHAFVKIT